MNKRNVEDMADIPNKEGPREKRPKHIFKSGAIYEGEWIGNMRDGYGV